MAKKSTNPPALSLGLFFACDLVKWLHFGCVVILYNLNQYGVIRMQATTMRLDPELIKKLKVEAKKDSRSLNNLINKVLSSFAEQSEKDKLAEK